MPDAPIEPDPEVPPRHDPYLAWREPNYRRYAAGATAALMGTQIQSVAIGWEIMSRSDNAALALGMVALAQAGPAIGLALPAGYLADRFDRRTVMALSLSGATLTSLALAGLSFFGGPLGWMYLVLILDATVLTLGRPARVALLPRLVPAKSFSNAVTWNSSLFQTASVAGPAIGGLMVAVSIGSAYLVCAATSLVFMVWVLRLKLRPIDRPKAPPGLGDVLEGLKFMKRQRVVLAAISLDMFAVLLGGAVYLLPIYAEDILGVGEKGFGLLRAAPALGALVMAMVIAHLPPIRHAGRTMLWSVAGFGLATIVFGLSRSFWLSMAMLALTGALDNVSVVVRHTLVQMLTPDHMRGRVSAVNMIFISASNELGGVESGVVAHFFGPVFSVVSGGVGTILVVLGISKWSPELRRYGRLDEARPEADRPEPASGKAKD